MSVSRKGSDMEAERDARIEAAAVAIYAWQWGTEDDNPTSLRGLDIGQQSDYRQMAAVALAAVGALDA